MDTLDKILAKVEVIREDQIRGLERVSEIRALLRPPEASPSPLPPPAPLPIVTTASWTEKIVPMGMGAATWVVRFVWKNLPTLGTILYLKATGQDEKILLYVNGLLGL